MGVKFRISVILFILPMFVWGKKLMASCKEEITNNMKFNIIKDSMEQVINLYPNCRDSDENVTECGKKETAEVYMNIALDTLNGYCVKREENKCPKCPDPVPSGPIDCSEIKKSGKVKSGVYTIYPRSRVYGTKPLNVFCDMDTDGGGWTVIQRRGNYTHQENFYRDWVDYKNGFGSIERDFWLGNENIYTLTNQGVYSLRIDLKKHTGEGRYSYHDSFWISNEANYYAIRVREFAGDVGDDLATHDGQNFFTKDRQNERRCPAEYHGAWWYSAAAGCGSVNINGLFLPGIYNKASIWWKSWTDYYGLIFTEMKIRHRVHKFETKVAL